MEVLNSLSKLVQTIFNTATNSIATVGKGLDITNHYVEENHKRITKTTTTSAQLSVARFNQDVADELEASDKLKAQYDAVVADW